MATITLTPGTTYQTWRAWEATAYAGDDGVKFPEYDDYLFDSGVNDLGLTRIRTEIRSVAAVASPPAAAYFNYALYHTKMSTITVPFRDKVIAAGLTYDHLVTYVHKDGASSALLNPSTWAAMILQVAQETFSNYGFYPRYYEILEPDTFQWPADNTIGNCIKAAGDLLTSSLPGVPFSFLAPSSVNTNNFNTWLNRIKAVSGANAYVSTYTYHGYQWSNDALHQVSDMTNIATLAVTDSKELAMLEHINATYIELMDLINFGRISAFQQYTLASPSNQLGEMYYKVDNAQTVPNLQVQLTNRAKMLRHFFRAIRPGAQRYAASSDVSTVRACAWNNPDTRKAVLVTTESAQSIDIVGLPAGTYSIRYTTGSPTSITAYDVGLSDQTISAGQTLSTSIPAVGVIAIVQNASAGTTQVTKSQQTTWNVASPVTKSQDTTWNIGGVVTKTQQTAWNVFAGTGVKVAFEGDQLTYGSGSGVTGAGTVTGTNYPARTMVGLGTALPGRTLAGVNLGAANETIANMVSSAATTNAEIVSTALYNILVFMAGTNDMDTSSARTAAQCIADIASYVAAARTAGWKVLIGTIPNRGDASAPSQNELNTVNASIRTNYRSWGGHGYVDFAAATELSDPTNTTYFQADKVALKAAGYQVMADVAVAAIEEFLQPLRAVQFATLGAPLPVPPVISNVTTNASTFPADKPGLGEKFVIQFDAASSMTVPLHRYDPAPPPGAQVGKGATVLVEYSKDNFATSFFWPCFYSKNFDYQTINGDSDWIYPNGTSKWNAIPPIKQEGTWQFKLHFTDAGGTTVWDNNGAPISVTFVKPSTWKGWIKVSDRDKRYWEWEDLEYFSGIGFGFTNSWDMGNPTKTKPTIDAMGVAGIKLIRFWQFNMGLWSATYLPWGATEASTNHDSIVSAATAPAGFIPEPDHDNIAFALETAPSVRTSQPNRDISYSRRRQLFACKPGTLYEWSFRTQLPEDLVPIDNTKPYGIALCIGGPSQNIVADGLGTTITTPRATATAGWITISAQVTSPLGQGNNSDYFWGAPHLTLKNCSSDPANYRIAYANDISVREVISPGVYGPNLISRPRPDALDYVDEAAMYRFGLVEKYCRQNGIAIKMTMGNGDYLMGHMTPSTGTYEGPHDNPNARNNAYGPASRTLNRARWSMQNWYWRFLAEFGWSPFLHSIEWWNEMDPSHGGARTFADMMAEFAKQFPQAQHMTTTSTWGDMPYSLWKVDCPNMDYADVHRYIHPEDAYDLDISKPGQVAKIRHPSELVFYDTVAAHEELSEPLITPQVSYGMPIHRGEVGFSYNGDTAVFTADAAQIWLHKMVWSEVTHPGALVESNYYDNLHIINRLAVSMAIYARADAFMDGIPVSNGQYSSLLASSSHGDVRVRGQKDIASRKAYGWIDNKTHTWKTVVDGVAPSSATGSVSFDMPDGTYTLTRYNTYLGSVTTEPLTVLGGVATVPFSTLTDDFAFKLDDPSGISQVTTSFTTTWNIGGAVSKTQQTAWNIIATLTKTQFTSWNILTAVSKSFDTTWNILTAVTKTASSTWNIQSTVTKTFQTTWNLPGAVTKTYQTTWRVFSNILAGRNIGRRNRTPLGRRFFGGR